MPMRNTGLWISVWVDPPPAPDVIIDTAVMTQQDWQAVDRGPDRPPPDTILVVVHPSRHADLLLRAQELAPLTAIDFIDPNGRNVAARLIDERCWRDPELRKRLRWE